MVRELDLEEDRGADRFDVLPVVRKLLQLAIQDPHDRPAST
jgi:hypothetical protein